MLHRFLVLLILSILVLAQDGEEGAKPSTTTENAVERGLAWLAAHQDEDGRWDSDGFMKRDPADDRCDAPGHADYDPAVTGLALLSFLGAGYTDRGRVSENRYANTVRNGLRFLMGAQDDHGSFGPAGHVRLLYNQSIATLALCEAYWMTRNPRYKMPAQEAVRFLIAARSPDLAWGHAPGAGNGGTLLTSWCVMALKSAKFGGLEVDAEALSGAREWIEKMTDSATGRVGPERFPPAVSEAKTAAGILMRVLLGENPRESDVIQRAADLCLQCPPSWSPERGSIDMYYWYLGTLALFQVGEEEFKTWNNYMKTAIVRHQRSEGAAAGSWDPLSAWARDGGRVYATALMTMSLEVYYRYDRLFGR